MKRSDYITITEICLHHHIEESFLYQLEEFELIRIKSVKGQPKLHMEELPKLEKMLRLHRELHINLEGIQSIYHLLERMSDMQEELKFLRNKLDRFEEF